MSLEQVSLKFMPDSRWVCLRELGGHDEQAVAGTGTVEAIRLLDQLLVAVPGSDMASGKAKALATADRDRLLAAVYIRTYGSRIQSTVKCNSCGAPFDMDFSLEELVRHLDSEAAKVEIEKTSTGVFKLPDGRLFRLPTGEDEYAVLGMSPEVAESTLLARCVVEGNPSKDHESLQRAMHSLAPVIDLDMDASCPDCNHQQLVHFDIQYYLLYSLHQEQKQLAWEVHQLAKAYGWHLNEILELPRRVRRTYVALVESDMDSQRRRSLQS